MTIEFKFLVWSLALTFVQMLIAATGATLQRGIASNIGNREGLRDLTGWPGRARRAQLNMLENMVLFAPLLIIADIAGKDNAMTELGAQMFFWARLAYAVIYVAGVPYLRTAVWMVSAVGMVLIFLQLV
jgi:uncharacterized MAPEG superfamily protein